MAEESNKNQNELKNGTNASGAKNERQEPDSTTSFREDLIAQLRAAREENLKKKADDANDNKEPKDEGGPNSSRKVEVSDSDDEGSQECDDSDDDDEEDDDEESDWSSAPASPAKTKTPRAFKKITLGGDQDDDGKEAEDWTWESEDQPGDRKGPEETEKSETS